MSPDAASSFDAPADSRALETRSRLYAWVATVDHKRIGILYLVTALVYFIIAGVQALIIRAQLIQPNHDLVSPDFYNQMFTMHGTTMIFLVGMPMLIGFANYFVPLMIGARDMAFPRLNALSWWLLVFGGLLLYFSFLAGGAPNTGWFSYAPLSERPYSTSPGVDYWIVSLLVLGAGSIAAAANVIATVLKLRAPGMTLRKLPLFVWMSFLTSFIIVLAIPPLNAAIVMLLIDRQLAAGFFHPVLGGSSLLWQHFFWAFGHPEVYILALPAFGMISEVIPVFSRKPIFGYGFVAGSGIVIALLSFGVWAHHMFAAGMGHPAELVFGGASMLIAVPTGVKIFNWIATMWGGSIRFSTAMLFAVGFLVHFTIGGLSGVTFTAVPTNWQTTDTYFVVAHLHYVLIGGTLFGTYAGLYYWFPKMSGKMLSERLGKCHFWLAIISFNLTFSVQHYLGLIGMPRRVYTYPDMAGWASLNLISTVGAFLQGLSAMILLINVVWSLRRGRLAGNNPWDAWTLEWATTSPPPQHNFDSLPPVRSRRPLWDLAHPESPDPPISSKGRQDDSPSGSACLIGMWTFVASEAVFFLMLMVAYLYYDLLQVEAQIEAEALDTRVAGVFTLMLLGSSLTFLRAEKALHKRDHRKFQAWLTVTLALGALFLAGQGREYVDLLHRGFDVNSSLFATSFFTLTGFHGLHVLIGLMGLGVVMWLARSGDFQTGHIEPVRTMGLYWHFVDIVWILVFSLIYLIGPYL